MAMTDEQIEAAARRLCGIRGVDPDWKLGPSHTQLDRAKYEVRAHLEVRQAIRDARADLDPKPAPQTFADGAPGLAANAEVYGPLGAGGSKP